MGKAIEEIAVNRGHEIVLRISAENLEDFTSENLKKADVAIEFSHPEAALENVLSCLKAGVPTVCGTTGWNEHLGKAKLACNENNTSFLHASNFSIGVNIFFEINKRLAALMNDQPNYDVLIDETHHTEKKDAPGGTAITLAEQVLSNLDRKKHWVKEEANADDEMAIISHRIANVPGTHIIKYSSDIDDIEIKHTAHSRKGFASGAVLAAEYIADKKGVFDMQHVLGIK